MKRVLLILSFSICFITLSFAQRNYAQELVNLLQNGKCFDAREFRLQYANKLPQHDEALDLLYKSHMALFFNKPDSATFYLEDLLGNQKYELGLGPIAGVYYGRLIRLYNDRQQFEEGISLCDKMLNYLKRNPFEFDQNFLQNEIDFAQNMKASFKCKMLKEPQIIIKRNPVCENITLNNSEYIRFNANYNDVTIETLFDTGVSHYFFIQEDLANEVGVKIIKAGQDSTQLINGNPVRAFEAIIDSIDLKGVKLYNIPVMVFRDKFTSHLSNSLSPYFRSGAENVFDNRQIIMGLPTMKLIGKLEFDWKNSTLSFPKETKHIGDNNSTSNIFLIHDNPYLRLKINGLDYVGYLDTGSNTFLNMTSSFYENNKDYIQIDTIAQKKTFDRHTLTGTVLNIPCQVVKNAEIYSDGKAVNSANNEILISNGSISHINIFDGEVGVYLLKKMGSKIIFNFNDMRIKIDK